MMIAVVLNLLFVTLPATTGGGVSCRDLVGRYTAEIIGEGAPTVPTTLVIDTTVDALTIRCIDHHGNTLFDERFSMSRASFGSVGARFSATDDATSTNLWLDALGTGQLRGRMEYFIHSPFSRSKITFRTVSSLGPVNLSPLDDLRSTFQQRQRTCSWNGGSDSASCGTATSHPTGLCPQHLESIRDE